jgi:hypothetical protein
MSVFIYIYIYFFFLRVQSVYDWISSCAIAGLFDTSDMSLDLNHIAESGIKI